MTALVFVSFLSLPITAFAGATPAPGLGTVATAHGNEWLEKEIGERPVLRSGFCGGTRLTARDDSMREHAIVKHGVQKHFAEVPPRGPGARPSESVARGG
jgi:hypothetical protein